MFNALLPPRAWVKRISVTACAPVLCQPSASCRCWRGFS